MELSGRHAGLSLGEFQKIILLASNDILLSQLSFKRFFALQPAVRQAMAHRAHTLGMKTSSFTPRSLHWTGPEARAEVVGKQIMIDLGVVTWGATVNGEDVGRDEGEPLGSEGAAVCRKGMKRDLVSPSKRIVITRRTIAMSFEATAMKPACFPVGPADLDNNLDDGKVASG